MNDYTYTTSYPLYTVTYGPSSTSVPDRWSHVPGWGRPGVQHNARIWTPAEVFEMVPEVTVKENEDDEKSRPRLPSPGRRRLVIRD